MKMSADSLKTRNLRYGRVPVTEIPKSTDYTENPDDVDDIINDDDDDNDDEGNKENMIGCGMTLYGSKHTKEESRPSLMSSIYSSRPQPARVRTVSFVLKDSRTKLNTGHSRHSGDDMVSSALQVLEPSSSALKPHALRNFSANDPILEKKEDAGTLLKTTSNSQLLHQSSGCRALRIPKSASKEQQDKVETFVEDVCDDDDEDDVKDDDDEEVKDDDDDDDLLDTSQRMHEAEAGSFAGELLVSGAGFGYGSHLYNQQGPLYNSTYPMSSQKRENSFQAPLLVSEYLSSSTSQKHRADNVSATGSFTNSSKLSDLFAPLEELSTYQTKTGRFGGNRFSEVVDSIKKSKKQEVERMTSCRKSIGFCDYDNDSQRSLHIAKSASATDLGRHQRLPAAALPRCGDAQKALPNFEVDGTLSDGSQNRWQDSAKTGGTGRMPRLVLESSCGTDTYKRLMSNSFLSGRSDLSLKSKVSDPLELSGRAKRRDLSGSGDGFHSWKPSQLSDLDLLCKDPPDQKSWRPNDWNLLETVAVNDGRYGFSGFDVDSPFMNMKTMKVNGHVYLIQKIIGKGGSSKVYKAISPNCETCAIKCVSFENVEESMISGYHNEIRLLKQLQNSEKIVKLHDYMFDRSANMLYVVMESGDMDLHAFFRTNASNAQFKQMLIRPYWIEMLHAVQVLHKQGIVHSDLKLANFILVCGQVKLIDFGIAKTVLPDCTSIVCDEIVGTFNYMSPEAITDLNGGRGLDGNYKPNVKISTKSDVWSLGCILYFLVYSCTPFEHIRNQIMKLHAIINPNHKVEFPPTKLAGAVEVIKKCLDRNPKSRPTIEELLDLLFVTNN